VYEIFRLADDCAGMGGQIFENALTLRGRFDADQLSLAFNLDRPTGIEHLIEYAIDVLPQV